MYIAEKLRQFRESKNLSQGDIEKRTGLLRCYISRVENGHTVPAIETLEKLARALEVPMYKLFYDGEEPPKPLLPKRRNAENTTGQLRQGCAAADQVPQPSRSHGRTGSPLAALHDPPRSGAAGG